MVVANGFVPLLEATLRALKIRSCLLPVPAFVEYRRTLERAGVEIVPYALRPESSFRYDPTKLTGQEETPPPRESSEPFRSGVTPLREAL